MATLDDLTPGTRALYEKGPRPDVDGFGLTPYGRECYANDSPETMLEIDDAWLRGEEAKMVG